MIDTASTQSGSPSSMGDKRRKSLSETIRARLSRSQSSEIYGARTSDSSGCSVGGTPPVPPVPRSYSMNTIALSNTISPSSLATVGPDELNAAWTSIDPPAFPASPQYTAFYCEENVYLLARHLSAHLSATNAAAHNIARQQARTRTSAHTQRSVFVPVWDVHVLFISNSTKTVLLYAQSASKLPSAGSPVIWDYHVVAVATCHLVPLHELRLAADDEGIKVPAVQASRSWVYDFDTLLSRPTPQPVPWGEYNTHTFHPDAIHSNTIPPHFRPVFRCVPAHDFLRFFASDRSHMLLTTPAGNTWHSPPPPWPPIVGAEARNEGCANNLMNKYVDVNSDDGSLGRYGLVEQAEEWLLRDTPPITGGLGRSIVGDAGALDVMFAQQPADVGLGQQVTAGPVFDERREVRGEGTNGGPIGGRISSPLFPAYLHTSQQHRAAAAAASRPASSTM
ncbi:hypothetical protein EX895_003356 [Sporisorium graminicola]|uniref:Protein N-terminal glutamine amidohydrolase n=1 Tax=Sporisorium graminicola TaxID=280036 RepID=A0A4U7KT57_9BASI|nr:hypothetical protein EX895_003356 [Sporisorium graminicola]TKY87775.1 hypothetical protein EX895_003356 [Sporisorium graminicola]